MADDPMTVDASTQTTIREGLVMWDFTLSGPEDYDSTNGSAFDLTDYVTSIKNVIFGSVTAAADCLVIPRYVNDDMDDPDGGAVYFTWNPACSGDAQNAAVLANVANATNLSGYQWSVTVFGTPVNS